MALKVADRVRENTSTTGTGALDLGGAPAGFRTFSSALSDADTTYYVIEENDQYEIGIGVYSSSALQRSVVLKSSNSDSKIELGGSGAVFISYPADKSVYRDGESQVVVGASGASFSNGTIIKDAKIVELTDINAIGTPSSSNIITFDFGDQNLLIGDSAGNFATRNVMIGDNVGNSTTPTDAVIIGTDAATEGSTINYSVFIGSQTGPTRSDVSNAPYYSVVMGYNAADEARHESSIIGYKAGINSYSIGATALGYFAGSGVGDYATSIGHQAGANNSDDYTINIGYQAGYSAGGDDSIWVGRVAGLNSNAAVKSIGLGYAAGQSSSADNSIYIGVAAGSSNSTDNMLFVGNNTPASNGSLLKGDIANKRLAIGAADVTLADTLYVGINSANDVGFTIKAATSQAADLTQWKDSAGSSVASLTNSGVMTVHGVYASGGGVQLNNITPIVTNNTLYNVGSVLYWDGSQLSGAVDAYTSGNATYASGEALSLTYASGLTATNASDIVEASGALRTDITSNTTIANYASGEAVSLTYASGLTATNATNISAVTSTANYASGQAIENEGLVAYASGNTANIAFGSNAEGDMLYHNGTNFVRLAKGTNNYILKMDGNVPNWEAESSGGDVSAADFNYVSGVANYSSGNTIVNDGLVAYASGQAIENESDLLYVSGAAAYSSGVVTGGDINVGEYIYHAGDADTYLQFTDDEIQITAGGRTYIKIEEDSTDKLIINHGALDIDVQIKGDGDANLIRTDAAEDRVGLGTASPAYKLDVVGGGAGGLIQATGVLIGASGVVSDGSIVSKAPNANTVPIVAQGAVSQVSNLQEWKGSNEVVVLQAAADGTISSSGNIYASGSVGVGINTPASKLHIKDASNPPEIRFEDAGGGTQTAKIVFDQAGQNSLVLSTQYQSASDLNLIQFAPADNVAMTLRGGTGSANGLVGIGTTAPAYGLDLAGAGANGLIQSSGILVGPSGIGVGTATPVHPIDVVQHSGVIRASGMHSAISMNADATTVTFDLDQATTHGVTLGGNRALALSNVQIGDKFLIRLQQDGTGSRTVNWFDHIKWAGGSAPTLTTTAHKTDLLGFLAASGTGGAYWFDGLVVGQNI